MLTGVAPARVEQKVTGPAWPLSAGQARTRSLAPARARPGPVICPDRRPDLRPLGRGDGRLLELTAGVGDHASRGWLHTGDIGHLDADGYLYVVDRKKDLIIRGGFNVYPRDVEDVLLEHPAAAMAGVVGRPDQRLGEEVVAFLSLRPRGQPTPQEVVGDRGGSRRRDKRPRRSVQHRCTRWQVFLVVFAAAGLTAPAGG
jgi:acyl-CoA synthetase (AMP-forming)/AMP-acid ligase II